jgi:KDO2-lipid IV(A) lauroyltransferase
MLNVSSSSESSGRLIVDEMLYEKRIRSGVYMEPADKSGVKNICRSLQQGALVIVLTDQVPKDKGAHYVPFFNRPAKTMSLPSKLFQRYQPRLILGCCIRDHSGQFEIHLKPLHAHIKQNRPYCQSDDPFAECLNRAYEQLINRYPEQYQWSYKRFKQPPQGYIDPYKSNHSFQKAHKA